MRTYLVCYDLAASAQRKPAVVDAIMTLGQSWARPLDNVWYIRTGVGAEEIEARLRTTIDLEDGILIQAVREEAVMLNTGLRWFRQRKPANDAAPVHASTGDNVIAFPAAVAVNDTGDLGGLDDVRAAS